MTMVFTEEPSGYEKTNLPDLRRAWAPLRESVVEGLGFEGCDGTLFQIDEAMS